MMALKGDVMWGRWAVGTRWGQTQPECGGLRAVGTLQLPHNSDTTPGRDTLVSSQGAGGKARAEGKQCVAGIARLCLLGIWGPGPPAGGEGLAERRC